MFRGIVSDGREKPGLFFKLTRYLKLLEELIEILF